MMALSLESTFEQVLSGVSGRMIVLGQAPFMFAGVNDNGRAALFIRVALSPSQIVSDGHGFSVKTTRSGNNDYVQITAADDGIPPLFLKLVEYLLERVSATRSVEEGAEMLIRSIDEYRRFVGQRRGRLSESMVRGTFAELLFMRTLIACGLSEDEAVRSWRGPWAKAGLGVHDFTFADGRGIEIKSTHQPPGTVRVSSPSQLLPSHKPLDLLVLPLEDAPNELSATVSFREYALRTAEIVSSSGPLAAGKWDDAMEALGLDLSDEWYDRYRFMPGDWLRFRVDDGFPHLELASLPSGMVDLHYSLELARLSPFVAGFDTLFAEMRLS